MQELEKAYFRCLRGIMAKLGVETLTTPRELYDKMVEVLPQAKKVRMAICDEWLFVMELPRMLVPDSDDWGKVTTMMSEAARLRDGKGIKVITFPKGSPSEIAQGWVGTTIPFSESIPVPMAFITPEMVERGMDSTDGRCYLVSSLEAVTALGASNPQAANAYKAFRTDWSDTGLTLLFNGDACEVVDIAGHS